MNETSASDQPLIRPARITDLEALIALTRNTYAEHALRQPDWFPPDALAPTEALLRQWLVPPAEQPPGWSSVHLVCEEDGGIVGYVQAIFADPGEYAPGRVERFGQISDISLAPEARGRGIGKRLLAGALASLRDAGCTIVSAQVWAGNDASDALFRGTGFNVAHTELRLRLGPASPLEKVPEPTFWQGQLAAIRPYLPILLILVTAGILAFLNR
jgi:ribosomal protein S18 acetylase RimI-like enzyme